jgi:hypothetical protein
VLRLFWVLRVTAPVRPDPAGPTSAKSPPA